MSVLRDELNNDPLGRGYSAMSHGAAADDLNTARRTRERDTLDAWEVYEAIDSTEWGNLLATQRSEIESLLSLGVLTAKTGSRTASRFVAIFTAQSNTVANLKNRRDESISRAAELGLPPVAAGHVEEARR